MNKRIKLSTEKQRILDNGLKLWQPYAKQIVAQHTAVKHKASSK